MKAWAGREWDPEGWRARCERKRPFVNVIDGRIAGFIELDPDGHVDCTFVHPDFARQGVMSGLMEAVKREARELGLDRLHAEVSITARPFFERHGFVWLKDQMVMIRGVELRNSLMEWRTGSGGTVG